MPRDLEQIKNTLFEAKDGGAAWKCLDALKKEAKINPEALKIMALYSDNGPIEYVRQSSLSLIEYLISEGDQTWVQFFRDSLNDPSLRFRAIAGYIKTAGAGAYPDIVRIAFNPEIPLIERAKAIQSLAKYSNQLFDRNLPSDQRVWKETDLRLDEIQDWAEQGYPTGVGYQKPETHPSLLEPSTSFEKSVAKLDHKLAKRRQDEDLANLYNWLVIASPVDIAQITARWKLPEKYLDFLTRFSPLNVFIESGKFADGLQLFGAGELLKGQEGYSFNPVTNELLPDWPSEYLVIGNDGGDPYILNLLESDGNDAPIYTAQHGMGRWDFNKAFPSFEVFLKWLVK